MYIQCSFEIHKDGTLEIWLSNDKNGPSVTVHQIEDITAVLEYSEMSAMDKADLCSGWTVTTGLYNMCVEALFEMEIA